MQSSKLILFEIKGILEREVFPWSLLANTGERMETSGEIVVWAKHEH